MDAAAVALLEAELRRSFDAGDLEAVATRAIEAYGPEIYGYLLSLVKAEVDAAEAFAELCHQVWRDLPRFRWDAALRTWMYTIARHRFISITREPARRRGRQLQISRSPDVEALAERVRTTTAMHLRTDVKQEVARLRERLDPDDQTLLVLRVDKGMSWREVAHVLEEPSEPALRKRFERIKARLRELAREAKLVP